MTAQHYTWLCLMAWITREAIEDGRASVWQVQS